jgi:hypothetical protein
VVAKTLEVNGVRSFGKLEADTLQSLFGNWPAEQYG